MLNRTAPIRVFDAADPRRAARAAEDLLGGLRSWRLAWALARSDLVHRYRGSVLGPIWLTLSTAVMLGALGFLYAKLFNMQVGDYLPWLAVSLIVWNILAQAAAEACLTLTSAEGIIRQMNVPYTVQALRTVMRAGLVAAHNLPLIFVVFLIFGVPVSWTILWAIPGLALLAVNAFWASLLLGVICARFRDIPPIVNSVVQIAFFVTPVIWKPELIKESAALLPLNPFFGLLEVVRGPILGTTPSLLVWASALTVTTVMWVVSQIFFTRFRGRVAFWV
jgi:lipopolysaccharide transport system permease protein